MQGFDVICENIIVLGLAMAIGFVAVKTGYISEEVKNAMSKVVVRITLPILVMMSLTKLEMTPERAAGCAEVYIISMITVGVMYLIGMALSRAFKMDKPRRVVYECMSAFGNVIFLGYPLIEAMYGAEGLLYAAIYAFANDCFVWTLGVYKLASIRDGKGNVRKNLKNLINPSTVAFAVSLVMMIFGWRFTGIAERVFSGVGGITTYLSMLFIGGTLAMVDFRRIYKQVPLFMIVAVKMIAVPSLLAALLAKTGLSEVIRGVIVLQAAMPSQTVLTMLTTEYNCDTEFSAEGVFVTSVAGLVTLPLVYRIMTLV